MYLSGEDLEQAREDFRFELFDYFDRELGITLLDSQIDDVWGIFSKYINTVLLKILL